MENKNKIRSLWMILSQNAVVDQRTNTLSVFNLIEQLTLPSDGIKKLQEAQGNNKTVIVPSEFVFTVLLEREGVGHSSQHVGVMEYKDPKGNTLQRAEVGFEFKPEWRRVRIMIDIKSMAFVGPGIYHATFSLKDDDKLLSVGSVPIEVGVV
jgi:hypothetical protein